MVNNWSVQLDRVVAAEPERVWAALTDAAALAAWFWPATFHTTATTDPRPGGAFRIAATNGPAGDLAVGGEYVEVAPPRRLVLTWRWDGDDRQTLVTIELSPVDGGTAIRVRHEGFADAADRDNHDIGWSDCLGRLPAYVGAASVPD